MSRNWTPHEWDIVHAENPELRELFGTIKIVNNDGTEVPLNTEEELALYENFPRLKLVGANVLVMCYRLGILDTEKGIEAVKRIDSILTDFSEESELSEKVKMWYEGKLVPGHYMTENNNALVEIIKEML